MTRILGVSRILQIKLLLACVICSFLASQAHAQRLSDGAYYNTIIPQTRFSDEYLFDPIARPKRSKSTWEQVKEGIASSFDIPWHELYQKKYKEEWKNLFTGINGSLSLVEPLKESTLDGERGTAVNRTLAAGIGYRIVRGLSLGTSASYRLNSDLREDDSNSELDFPIRLSFNSGKAYAIRWRYSNRILLNPDKEAGQKRWDKKQGSFSAGMSFKFGDYSQLFTFGDDGSVGCSVTIGYTPYFTNFKLDEDDTHRTTASLGCRYSIKGGWFMSFGVPYFFKPDHKQSFSPDYTYSFGYYNWRPWAFSLSYSNYSANRFPWNKAKRTPGQGRFKNGTFSLSWNIPFGL